MDNRCLWTDLGRLSHAHGESGRCLRSEEDLHCRDCPVHYWLYGGRSCPIPSSPDHLQGIARNRSGNVNGYGLCDLHTNIPRRTPKESCARGSRSSAFSRIRCRGSRRRSSHRYFWVAFSYVRQRSNWDLSPSSYPKISPETTGLA